MSWLGRLHRLNAEAAARNADPLRMKIEDAVRGKEAVSTAALLDLLNLPKTTGSARLIAKSMRALGFVPIKSRRLMPGGFRDTVARGWARPVRQSALGLAQGETVGTTQLYPQHALEHQEKEPSHVSRC